jgi:hypothetical protein
VTLRFLTEQSNCVVDGEGEGLFSLVLFSPKLNVTQRARSRVERLGLANISKESEAPKMLGWPADQPAPVDACPEGQATVDVWLADSP